MIQGQQSGKVPLEYIVYVDHPEVISGLLAEPSCKDHALKKVRKISKYMEVYLLRSKRSLNQELENLLSHYPGVISFQSNFLIELRENEPNDPQWTAQEDHILLNTAEVWDVTTGGQTHMGKK